MDSKNCAIEIYKAGVKSVLPEALIYNSITLKNNILSCNGNNFNLAGFDHIYLIGFGKASAAMAQSIEKLLGNRISGGHVITKYGHGVRFDNLTLTEAGHPIPDNNGISGSKKILQVVSQATAKDLIIAVISGGGSALLADVPEEITLDELKEVNSLLVNSGADIREMNAVRKHISGLKGGQLARFAHPAALLTLLVSDVVGDPLDVIASGPTVADPSTFAEALQVIERFKLENSIPTSVTAYLEKGRSGKIAETVKEGDPVLLHTCNYLLGSNKSALQEAKIMAEHFGYSAIVVTDSISGDVGDVAEYLFFNITRYASLAENRKRALLFGGEPTVRPAGKGKGGRNQHLVLLMTKKIAGMKGITFLSAGTDGTDGPTDAAGAVCDGTTLESAIKMGIDIENSTRNFDAYPFFEAIGGLLKTGPTLTNVMDLMVVLIED